VYGDPVGIPTIFSQFVNVCAKNYKNQTIPTKVMAKNVEDPFLRQCSFKDIIDFPGLPWGRNQNSTQKAFNAD